MRSQIPGEPVSQRGVVSKIAECGVAQPTKPSAKPVRFVVVVVAKDGMSPEGRAAAALTHFRTRSGGPLQLGFPPKLSRPDRVARAVTGLAPPVAGLSRGAAVDTYFRRHRARLSPAQGWPSGVSWVIGSHCRSREPHFWGPGRMVTSLSQSLQYPSAMGRPPFVLCGRGSSSLVRYRVQRQRGSTESTRPSDYVQEQILGCRSGPR